MSVIIVGLCGICGERGKVEPALVSWVEPVFKQYEHIDRCVDREACRVRVFESGGKWPVREPKP